MSAIPVIVNLTLLVTKLYLVTSESEKLYFSLNVILMSHRLPTLRQTKYNFARLGRYQVQLGNEELEKTSHPQPHPAA